MAQLPKVSKLEVTQLPKVAQLPKVHKLEVTYTLLASRKQSTIRIYNTTWKEFTRECKRKSVDTLKPSLESVLHFLQNSLKT